MKMGKYLIIVTPVFRVHPNAIVKSRKNEMKPKDKKKKRPYTPSIRIGRYVISRWSKNSVLIEDLDGGDAGEFEVEKFEKVIEDFFGREF